MLTIYLDNCCYNRPFDDRSNIKNYLERESVLIIMQMAYEGSVKIVGSEVLKKEISLISSMEKRKDVESIYNGLISSVIVLNEWIIKRAEEIMQQSSIRAFDSLHLASAEAGADILLTTDIKFMKAANRLEKKVRVRNPINFLLEVGENEYGDSSDKGK